MAAAVLGHVARDEFDVWRIRQDLVAWDHEVAVSDDRRLGLHAERAAEMLQRRPWEFRLHYLSARLDAWLAQMRRRDRRAAAQANDAAGRGLRAALQLRPLWGPGWAAYLGNRLQAGERPDPALYDRALALSPFDLDTENFLVQVAFQHWPDIDSSQRPRFTAVIRRVVEGDKTGIARDYLRKVSSACPRPELLAVVTAAGG